METENNIEKIEKKKYKLIILIIASRGGVYNIFMDHWNKYMNTRDDIRSFFVFGQGQETKDNHLESFSNVSIIAPFEETFVPGILQKTVHSYGYIDEHFDYDYIMRTNLSSMYDINQLSVFIDNLPKTGLYCGERRVLPAFDFISGSCFILSKDIVKLLLENVNDINFSCIDDCSIALLMKKLNIPITSNMTSVSQPINNITIYDNSKNINYFYYYRMRALIYTEYDQNIKQRELEDRVNIDGEIAKKIYSLIYG